MDAPLPLLVLGLARPVLLDRRPAWAQAGRATIAWCCSRCRRNTARCWPTPCTAAAHGPAIERSELAELLTRQSGGNPYYMEELLKMLIDDGVLAASEGRLGNCSAGRRWPAHWLRVPSTLAGVLQARLDALAAAERAGAAAGQHRGPRVLGRRAGGAGPAGAFRPSARAAAQGPGAAAREGSAFEGTTEEAFGHHLLHQVAYETVLKAERRAGHAAGLLPRPLPASERTAVGGGTGKAALRRVGNCLVLQPVSGGARKLAPRCPTFT
jgi:hypothetical protein